MAVDAATLKLPAVSSECSNVLEMLDQEDVSVSKLGKVISLDPILSSTLLKYANSPLYRRSTEVTNVTTAINLLGSKNVCAAVMMATMRAFSGGDAALNLKIWEHSVAISAIGRLVCKASFRGLENEIELVGILHEMPALVMATNYPNEYKAMLESARDDATPHEVLWRELFGISQDDIMARVAKDFRLPEKISDVLCVYHTHPPLDSIDSDQDRLIAMLSLAHHIEKKGMSEDILCETTIDDLASLLELLNLSEEDIENIAEDSELAMHEHMQM